MEEIIRSNREIIAERDRTIAEMRKAADGAKLLLDWMLLNDSVGTDPLGSGTRDALRTCAARLRKALACPKCGYSGGPCLGCALPRGTVEALELEKRQERIAELEGELATARAGASSGEQAYLDVVKETYKLFATIAERDRTIAELREATGAFAVNVDNPDTCGVCGMHFEECEEDQHCVGDEMNEQPSCPGARARAVLRQPGAQVTAPDATIAELDRMIVYLQGAWNDTVDEMKGDDTKASRARQGHRIIALQDQVKERDRTIAELTMALAVTAPTGHHPCPYCGTMLDAAEQAEQGMANVLGCAKERDQARAERDAAQLAYEGAVAVLNTPELHDFAKAVALEAAHQRVRWGTDHDAGKAPADWYWLLGWLAGKAVHAQMGGHQDKALHHVITTAAACANWHAAITGADTKMRPGIDTPDGETP